MKLLKIFSGFILVVVILIAVAVFYVANNINDLVKTAVEEQGSNTLQTAVTLQKVDIKLMQGRVNLSGLIIANPPGFSESQAFQMDNIVVDLDLASLRDRLVNIKAIKVDGAHIVAEQKGVGTNLQALMKNIDSGSKTSAPAEQETAVSDVLIKVGLFDFTNSSMKLVSQQWGGKEMPIPTITLKNLGGDAGLPPEKLAAAILKPLVKQLNESMQKAGRDLIEAKAKEKIQEKQDELKQKMSDQVGDKLNSLFSR